MEFLLRTIVCTCCVLSATAGVTQSTVLNREGTSSLRVWTNASGTRQAQAALLRVTREKLWLRRADGRIVTTTFDRLSPQDKQYVKMWQATVAPRRPKAVKTSQAATVVYLRLSRDFLEDYVERNVRQRRPVRDCILGTRIVGESTTHGRTRLVLRESNDKVLGEIAFEGTVRARTLGYNGPVVLHSLSDAAFCARKAIVMDNSGLRVAPAATSVHTQLKTTHIETSLPRLRGRIARRIAWRRSASSRGRAEIISSQHTAATISRDLDKRIDQSVANVRQNLQSPFSGLEVDVGPKLVRFRTTPEYVAIAMMRMQAGGDQPIPQPPQIEGNPDIAVRVHRSLWAPSDTSSQLSEKLAPFLINLLKARVKERALGMRRERIELPINRPEWSLDSNWLTLDFTDFER
jgi:hypothetical protein